MKKNLVSVIIPTYNSAGTLPRAIESVLAQDYANVEIIVVDDHSNDGTEKALGQYLARYASIRYIYLEKNSGPAGARNAGAAVAEGEYIAFLDADDEWGAGKISKQVEFLSGNVDVDLIFTDCTNITTANNVARRLSEINGEFLARIGLLPAPNYPDFFILEGNYRQELYRKFFILISSVLMRRLTFKKVNGFNANRFGTEDVDFFVRLSLHAKFAYWRKEKVIRYQSDEGISSANEKWHKELISYHKMCLSSADYTDLREIAKKNLSKIYGYLLVFYAKTGSKLKALNVFWDSLKALGFHPKIFLFTIIALMPSLLLQIWEKITHEVRMRKMLG